MTRKERSPFYGITKWGFTVSGKEATAKLRASGIPVREPKRRTLPQPLDIPGLGSEWSQHINCCEECDRIRNEHKKCGQ